jgi:hypothetical protein
MKFRGLADGYYGFERNARRIFEDAGTRFPTSVTLTPWKQLDAVPSASGTRRHRRWSSWILSPARVVWAVLQSLAFRCGFPAVPETRHRCGASQDDCHPPLPWKHTGLQLICLDEKLGIYYTWISVRCLFAPSKDGGFGGKCWNIVVSNMADILLFILNSMLLEIGRIRTEPTRNNTLNWLLESTTYSKVRD